MNDNPETFVSGTGSAQAPRAVYRAEVDTYVAHAQQHRATSRLEDPTRIGQLSAAMHKVYSRQTILFCVDVEAWERDTKQVTEIGISIYDPRDQETALTPVVKTIHVVIAENQNRKNGRWVPEHLRNFCGGTSHVLSKLQACEYLQWLAEVYFVECAFPCTLVGHDIKGDLCWLSDLGVVLPRTLDVLDTQKVFSLSHGKHGASLKNALAAVHQPFAFLHNAGNDAYFTVLLALRLCDPCVRTKTRLDVRPADEDPEVPRKFPKQLTNKSHLVRSTMDALKQYALE